MHVFHEAQSSLPVVFEGALCVLTRAQLLCVGAWLLVQLVGVLPLLTDMRWGSHSAHKEMQ